MATEFAGQGGGLGTVTADDLDAVAGSDRPGAENSGHGSETDDTDAAHAVCLLFIVEAEVV
jgi:hypothetical protein